MSQNEPKMPISALKVQLEFEKNTLISVCGFTNYFHKEKITAYYEKSHTIEKKSK
jgi:hypothetical protein